MADGERPLDRWERDAELLEAYRRGQASAGRELVARYIDSVTGYVRLREPRDSQDLVQHIMCEFYAALGRIENGRAVQQYVFRIAERTVARHRQRRAARPATQVEDSLADPGHRGSSLADDRQQRRVLMQALSQLSLREQHIFVLNAYMGMKLVDIAETLDVSDSTVRSTVDRARKKLKKIIGELNASGRLIDTTQASLNTWVQGVIDAAHDGGSNELE